MASGTSPVAQVLVSILIKLVLSTISGMEEYMRTVVFGIDGLSFRILDPLMTRGDLPNFARLQAEGVRAPLISSIPPVTPPAWMSLVTGLKPARHGVFDFWEFDSSGRCAHPVTHRKGGKAIWNILSEQGLRVIVMNVPITYPPEPVNGLMVSGLMTPGSHVAYTYPESLQNEIQQFVPGYRIDLSLEKTVASGYFQAVLEMTEKRIQLQEYLLSNHEWDFAFLCYVGADRIQHKDWEQISAFGFEATSYYRLIDDALGKVMARLAPEDQLWVVSDHGFVGANHWFYINQYLHQRELLQFASSFDKGRATLVGTGRELAKSLGLLRLVRKARETFDFFFGDLPIENTDLYRPVYDKLDWERTQASVLSPTAFIGGAANIFLAPGISPATLEELRQALEAERHPETGEPLIEAIYATSAFGIGPYHPLEEHLVVLPRPGITFHLDIGHRMIWETRPESRGIHEKEGIFYARGGNIHRALCLSPLQIYDLVPTLLHGLKLTSDQIFDGRIAHEVFRVSEPPGAQSEGLVREVLNRLQNEHRLD